MKGAHERLPEVLAENEKLRAELAELRGSCICTGPGHNGPDEDCPLHGKQPSDEIRGLRAELASLKVSFDRTIDREDALRAEVERLRGALIICEQQRTREAMTQIDGLNALRATNADLLEALRSFVNTDCVCNADGACCHHTDTVGEFVILARAAIHRAEEKS